jgi:hypothetical protein
MLDILSVSNVIVHIHPQNYGIIAFRPRSDFFDQVFPKSLTWVARDTFRIKISFLLVEN